MYYEDVLYWLKSRSSRAAIKFMHTHLGNYCIYKLRSSPFDLWEKTKRIRKTLVSWNEGPVPIREGNFPTKEMGSRPRDKLYQVSAVQRYEHVNSNRVQIIAPEVRGAFHTVTALALYQKQILSSNFPVLSLLSPHTLSPFRSDFDILLNPLVRENSIDISIYHLGNHPSSVPVLQHFLLNSSERKILLLHDLNLVDLAIAYCSHEYSDHTFFEYIQNQLGAYGSVAIGKKLSGLEILTSETKSLAKAVVNELFSHANAILTHTSLEEYFGDLPAETLEKTHLLDLPIGYFPKGAEQPPTSKNPNKVIISGHSNPAKSSHKIILAINEAMIMNPKITCLVLGGIVADVKKILRESVKGPSLKNNFEFIDLVDDQSWEALHRSAALGIRLGVGANGESSGLIRDYIYFDLDVITDEKSRIMKDNPKVTVVNSSIEISELAILIGHHLNKTLEVQPRQTHLMGDEVYLTKMTSTINGLSDAR